MNSGWQRGGRINKRFDAGFNGETGYHLSDFR